MAGPVIDEPVASGRRPRGRNERAAWLVESARLGIAAAAVVLALVLAADAALAETAAGS